MSVLSGHAAAFEMLSLAFMECSTESMDRALANKSDEAGTRAMLMADFGLVFGMAAQKLEERIRAETTGAMEQMA